MRLGFSEIDVCRFLLPSQNVKFDVHEAASNEAAGEHKRFNVLICLPKKHSLYVYCLVDKVKHGKCFALA